MSQADVDIQIRLKAAMKALETLRGERWVPESALETGSGENCPTKLGSARSLCLANAELRTRIASLQSRLAESSQPVKSAIAPEQTLSSVADRKS